MIFQNKKILKVIHWAELKGLEYQKHITKMQIQDRIERGRTLSNLMRASYFEFATQERLDQYNEQRNEIKQIGRDIAAMAEHVARLDEKINKVYEKRRIVRQGNNVL